MDWGGRLVSSVGWQGCVLIEGMAGQTHSEKGGRVAPFGALLLLCFLWSLGTLRSDLFPSLAATASSNRLERQALPFALLAVLATGVAVVRGAKWPRGRELGACAIVGLGLFVVPQLLIHLGSNRISDGTRVALFSLVPLFAVVFEPHLGRLAAPQNRSGMMAALVAVGGTLLVFPVDLPESLQAGFAFCALVIAAACVAAANCWAVRIAAEGISMWSFAAVAGAAALVGPAAAGLVVDRSAIKWSFPPPDLAWSTAVELPGLLLLFWLLRRMSAVRMATRFLLAPLLANLIGLILLRPAVGVRGCLGLLLIAFGTGWLLFARDDERESAGSTLNLDSN